MSTKTQKVNVSPRALLARINRKLRPENRAVRQCRPPPSRDWSNLGDYYAVDFEVNCVCDKHIDLGALGKRLGVLKPYEALAE